MALTPVTPREKLDRLLQYVVRARRYWWLAAGMIVLGAGLSLAFALTRPRVYQSAAVLFYQEKIQTSVLQNRDVSTMQRNIGERYRELLLARSSLVEVVRDPALNPFPDVLASEGEDAAVEELRLSIGFVARGANTFIIRYSDSDPDRARDVTARLTELLQAKESSIRLQQAEDTAKFAEGLRAKEVETLRQLQSSLNRFLVSHPEFAIDAAEGQGEGASIRAQEKDKNRPRNTTETALQALERQRARIKARIANPNAAPPPERTPRVRTPAQIAADQKVAEAQRELDAAERAEDEALRRFTERHPDAVKARTRVEAAKAAVAAAKAAVPPDPPDETIVATPVDKGQLEKELADVERQITAERARQRGAREEPDPEPKSSTAAWVVELEDEYQRLRLEVDEQRERVQNLADSAFRSKLEAEQRAAEQGASLAVVDPAFKPLKPTGKGKKMMLLGGMMVFTLLGCGLALGLGIIDDRIYRRADLDNLELAPTLAVIPRPRSRARSRQRRSRKA